MSVTIPRAGTSAGRSASIRIHEPQTGEIIAGFGDTMASIGKALENERLDRQRGQDRLALSQGIEDLRLQASQIGDPDQLDAFWRDGMANLRKGYLGRVDPKLRPDAELEFDGLAFPHTTQIGRQQLGLINDQRMATYTSLRESAIRQAVSLDPAGAAEVLATQERELDRLVSLGLVPADRAVTEKRALWVDYETTRATEMLGTNPQGLADAIKAGEFSRMEPAQAAAWGNRALSAVAAENARAAAAAKAENSARIAAVRDLAGEADAAARAGRVFARQDEFDAIVADPELAQLPEVQKAARSYLLKEAMPGFAVLPSAEQARLLAEERARPVTTADENRLAEAMQEAIDARAEAVRKDAWGYAAEVGLTAPQPLPDPSSPEFDTALRQRKADMARLEGAGIMDRPAPVFTPAEVERFAPLASASASPAERADLAARLALHLPPDAMDRAAAELKAGDVFGYVGAGLAAGELPPLTARQAFAGERAIASKNLSLPGTQDFREPWFEGYADLFEDGTGDLRIDETIPRDRILATANAIYAYKAQLDVANTKDGKINETIWKQSLHEAMGGIGTVGSSDARGGLGSLSDPTAVYGSYSVLLPPGVAAAEVQGGLDRIETVLTSADWAQKTDPGRTDRVLSGLSRSGKAPLLGGQPIDAATWSRLRLKATDQGFAMIWQNPNTGEERIVEDASGAPWIIDPLRLTRGGQR